MSSPTKFKLKKILTAAGGYLFLFVAYIAILYDYAYDVRLAFRGLISLMPGILVSLGCCAVYVIVNHVFIKKVVGLKPVVIFESILVLLMLILLLCNVQIDAYFARLKGA